MEKHRCKLCLRKFANGRALGGHMRSHMMNLYVTQKKEEQQQEQHKAKGDQQQLSEEFELVQSSEEENQENPKKSKRFIDPEFSSAVEAGSAVLQDRESETESSKNQNCRRSKRIRKSRISNAHHYCIDQHNKEPKGNKVQNCAQKGKPDESSSLVEHEPVSSISDITPEEDVAYCLMMLSRDKWMKEKDEEDGDDEEQEEEAKTCVDNHSKDVGAVKVTKARCKGKYRCETCNKVFKSYQALGGHRASHKRVKVNNDTATQEASQVVMETENAGGATGTVSIDKPFSRMIDLNLPAPLDDDDEINQMELSTVSDADCVNPIRH